MTDQFRVQYQTGFTIVPNMAMRDERLSIAARGFLGLIMSMSDTWTFRRNDLMKRCGVGRDKYRSLVAELETHGYLVIKPLQGDDGRFTGTTWCIFPDAGQHDRVTEGLKTRPSVPTRGLKNRLPVLTASGEIHPLKKNNLREEEKGEEESVPLAQIDDLFEEFWETYPRPADIDRSRVLFADAVTAGTDAADIIRAARMYAAEQEGNATKFIAHSSTWLARASWNDNRPSNPKPEQHEIDAFQAATIKKGYPALVSSMSDAQATYLVRKELVTVDECRAVGLHPTI